MLLLLLVDGCACRRYLCLMWDLLVCFGFCRGLFMGYTCVVGCCLYACTVVLILDCLVCSVSLFLWCLDAVACLGGTLFR